jgi:hypothetical protein
VSQPHRRPRFRRLVREFWPHVLSVVVTLLVIEAVLRALNPHYLRANDWSGLSYRYDPELGWSPVPNSKSMIALPRTVEVSHNSLGIRDAEYVADGRPAVLVMGDSLTWGYNVEASERFTDALGKDLSRYRFVNAGVSGFGTDQEFLFLQRLWGAVQPAIVVLIFCTDNDRTDNSRNQRYFSYKPYLRQTTDGWKFDGLPPPKARRTYFGETWIARNSMLARLAISGYVEMRHPRVTVPDPTERLVRMMRDYVRDTGATFLAGLEDHDPTLEAFLRAQEIPYVTFEGAELYDSSHHWTPEGHVLVARRLATLFKGRALADGAGGTRPEGAGAAGAK